MPALATAVVALAPRAPRGARPPRTTKTITSRDGVRCEVSQLAEPPAQLRFSMDADAARAVIEPAFDEDSRQRCMSGDFTPALSAEDIAAARAMSPGQTEFALTYGELTYEGCTRLGEILAMGPDDVFYDLGSGLGRATIQAHLQWGVKRAVGVELSAERSAQARRAVERLEQNGQLDHSRRLDLVCANLLDGGYQEATAVYLCCCCWDSTFVAQALEVLEKRAVNLRQIVTIEPLDRKFGLRPAWLTLKLETRVGQTWAPEGYPCYVYEVTR